MKSVLMIAYYYPPAGGAGVQRTLKFTKYLPDFGWNPLVLTVAPRYHRLLDNSISGEIPAQVQVQTTSAMLLPHRLPWKLRNWISRWLLLVDEQVGWYWPAVQAGKTLLQEHCIDAIYSTSSPYTDHLIGLALKRASGLPWLTDFRDPWCGNFSRQPPTPLHQRLDQSLERRVIQAADRLIVVSEPMRSDLITRYPALEPEKIITITNGYDQADISASQPKGFPPDRLSIVYTGSFYSKERTPHTFLRALAGAVQNGAIPREKVHVYFVGNIGQHSTDTINETWLVDLVTITGYLPHQESIAYLLGADIALLIIGANPGSEAVLTGKIFEYLAAHKPILALAPPGAAADLLLEANAGILAPPDDISAITSALVDLYHRWENGKLRSENRPEIVERYDRCNLTSTLAMQLDDITPHIGNS
jgi:glycosyltransferase involved in cell wall biosynthesis